MENQAKTLEQEGTKRDWQTLGPVIPKNKNISSLTLSWQEELQLVAETRSEGSSVESKSTGQTIADAQSVEEGGRTFQAYRDGQKSSYYLPNDGPEQDRLDLQHKVFRILTDGKLGYAPVHEPKYVLDIATGTGIWALDYAEENPKSHVVGSDLSLIQPSRDWVSNCEFIREDAEDPWVYPYKFDYVHLRAVVTCFNDTKAVIKQAFDNMNEGGWIEFQDAIPAALGDGSVQGTAIKRCSDLFSFGMGKLGRDVFRPMHYKAWLEEVGFTDVVQICMPLPTNSWPKDPKFKEAGRWFLEDISMGLEGIMSRILPAAGLSPEESKLLIDQTLKEYRDTSVHAFSLMYIVYGKKPFAHEVIGLRKVDGDE